MTKQYVVDRVALLAIALICWAIQPCLAQTVPDDEGNPRQSQPCVLLQNDNVLFGRAYQVGEYVVVQTDHGGEVQLSRKEVSCWARSLRDLYRYRMDNRQQGDIAAHLRDARWCLQYDLYDLAAQEIATVLKIDPGNLAAKSVQDQLHRLTESRERMRSNVTVGAADLQPVGYRDETAASATASVDLVSLRGFASHVQPMLLNRCGRCHSSDAPRRWTLVVPSTGARASSKITHTNLASSLPYLDRDSPANSELLVKATTPHGGVEAQLSPRNAKAIESLKRWIAMTVNAMPPGSVGTRQLDQTIQQPDGVAHQTTASKPQITGSQITGSQITESQITESQITESQIRGPGAMTDNRAASYQVPPSGLGSPQAPGQPARLPQVENPFDPDLFNRRFHPGSR